MNSAPFCHRTPLKTWASRPLLFFPRPPVELLNLHRQITTTLLFNELSPGRASAVNPGIFGPTLFDNTYHPSHSHHVWPKRVCRLAQGRGPSPRPGDPGLHPAGQPLPPAQEGSQRGHQVVRTLPIYSHCRATTDMVSPASPVVPASSSSSLPIRSRSASCCISPSSPRRRTSPTSSSPARPPSVAPAVCRARSLLCRSPQTRRRTSTPRSALSATRLRDSPCKWPSRNGQVREGKEAVWKGREVAKIGKAMAACISDILGCLRLGGPRVVIYSAANMV